jgi:hypothetical protein
VVAGEAISPFITYAIARSQDEDAALLYRIAAAHTLSEARCQGAHALEEGARVEGLTPAVCETCRPKARERWVGVERSREPCHLAEALQVLWLARADHDETGAAPIHLGLCRGQVSDLLTAEDSSEMAHEGEDGRLFLPRAAEGNRAPVSVEHGESGQS